LGPASASTWGTALQKNSDLFKKKAGAEGRKNPGRCAKAATDWTGHGSKKSKDRKRKAVEE